jgi:hypothetical protein
MNTRSFVLSLFIIFGFFFSGCVRRATIAESILLSSVIVSSDDSKGTGVVISSNKVGDLEETLVLTAKHIVQNEKVVPLFSDADFDKALKLITLLPEKYDVSYDMITKNMVLIEKSFSPFVRIITESVENGVSKNREIWASVKYLSKNKDLVILSFVSKKTLLYPARIRKKNKIIEGEELWACGFAISELTLTKGVLGRKIYTNTERGLYTGGVIGGSSGGGIFDKDGFLVGIIINVQGRSSTGPVWHLCGFEFVDKKEIELLSKK